MKKLILLLCLAFAANFANAQVLRKSFEVYSLAQATLTNAATLTFDAGYMIPGAYALSWQVEIDSVSGTPAGTVYLEGSNCSSCADWSAYASYAIQAVSAQDTTFVVPEFPFYRARVRIAGSGTQSQRVGNHVRWVKN